MPEEFVVLRIDGRPVRAATGTSVSAALINAGLHSGRKSVSGEPRGPVCGMGICFECRVTIDGVPGVRGCTKLVRDGMEVVTDLR